ncbi:MAG: thioesterase [Alphaproteobacteria bacterium]|nr:thioesterase [Alphaproteobacteria bacterium]HCP01387.1 thioesterase [Rhodospirillaceae bacterium]
MSKITPEAFNDLTDRELPIAANCGFRAEEIGDGAARVRAPFSAYLTRPGGTISGPVMMALTDFGMYAALMGAIGPVELAVTTNLNINFLRLPAPVDVIAHCSVIKLGRRLAVIEVTLYSEGDSAPIAHATGTYSIPPETGR